MTNSKILNPQHLLPLLIIGASILVSFAIVAQAQTTSPVGGPTEEEIGAAGIAFPVPELGNCADKSACRSYCNEPGNMESCIKFAQSHGLMNKEEAERGLKFQKQILSRTTPGGCSSPESCEKVCGSVSNLESCLKFADEQGFKEEKIDEARKVLSYLKSGGQMPGGCTSESSCRTYCGDFSHAEECFNFAEKAGVAQVKGKENLKPEQLQKFIELAKKGETPGGCKSKEGCESYCGDPSRAEECIAFGEKIGFLDKEKAELFRKTGGKGPGGCNSEESCRAYCNDPGRQEECFKFGEEHGLVNKEDIKEAKEGFVRVRQGLEQAPPEVAECLKSNLGQNIIQDIQSGQLTPGTGIGEKVKGCFDKFGQPGEHEGMQPASLQDFKNFIERGGSSTLGNFKPEGFGSAGERETPGLNRETFEKFRQEGGFKTPEGFKPPEGFKSPEGSPRELPQQFRDQLKQQFQQQFQGEFQKQYDQQYQQYQKPPEGTSYPTSGTQLPPSGEQYRQPTSPPPSTAPSSPPPSGTTAPPPPPPSGPTPPPPTQGNAFQAIKYFLGF